MATGVTEHLRCWRVRVFRLPLFLLRAPASLAMSSRERQQHRSLSLVVDGNGSGSKFLACCGAFAVLVRRPGVCCAANGTWGGKTSGERARSELCTSTESTGSW